jgi:hypothetical protein
MRPRGAPRYPLESVCGGAPRAADHAHRHASRPLGGLLAALLLPLRCGGPGPVTTARGTFEPSWSDEFDGTAAVREPAGFSTGDVMTGDWGKPILFQQAFGRFEALVLFPRPQGHWFAFWLENPDVGRVDGSGRDGTEIDVVERAWLVDQVQHTLHWDGYDEAHRSAEQKVTGHGLNDRGWHVFRLDWYPDEYVFYVDGVETWRTSASGGSGRSRTRPCPTSFAWTMCGSPATSRGEVSQVRHGVDI